MTLVDSKLGFGLTGLGNHMTCNETETQNNILTEDGD